MARKNEQIRGVLKMAIFIMNHFNEYFEQLSARLIAEVAYNESLMYNQISTYVGEDFIQLNEGILSAIWDAIINFIKKIKMKILKLFKFVTFEFKDPTEEYKKKFERFQKESYKYQEALEKYKVTVREWDVKSFEINKTPSDIIDNIRLIKDQFVKSCNDINKDTISEDKIMSYLNDICDNELEKLNNRQIKEFIIVDGKLFDDIKTKRYLTKMLYLN